ncbi:TBC1 domain family member 12-like isoform X2 [Halichondria panicea]|uniref:TBC1 domain family member 12-like isoform X2 n=1 Tax=Halichondria panicea TaxID=6063 RepID=UPI00312BBAA1
MDDQTSSEEEITAGKLQTDLTDSGVSSSVASDDSILKHKVLQHMNGLAIEDLQSSSTLSSSLQEGLEKTELLLTTSNPLGLSSVSLEVRTSGEQLNLLAEGLESPPESVSGRSQEDEVEGTKTRECASSPDETSRSSSSLGCLEPRPSRLSPTSTPVHPTPHDLLSRLTTEDCVRGEESCSDTHSLSDVGGVVAPPTEGVDSPRSVEATISSSQSTQSLNTLFGIPKGKKSFASIFNRNKMTFLGGADHTSQTMVAASSTTGLILHNRPGSLPAKSEADEKRHQRLYEQMMSSARKKEVVKAKEELRREEQRRRKDKIMEDRREEWARILPKWESVYESRKVHNLWWYGLPPGIRGKVWQKAIGNDLNISPDLYEINLRRCRERLATVDKRSRSDSAASLSREQSVENIHLDVLRTFPTLGFFQEGGPYNQPLHDVLGAYACSRPDIGYVQGMSFLAAVLLLNMEPADAFISLANLLNRPSYLAFFKVDHALMRPYFDTFNILLHNSLPKLSAHFSALDFSPEYYLIEWIFTIYTRTLPLDVACRVWDLFCRDGDCFLFKTALGILKLHQSDLLELNTIEDVGGFLGKLPPSLDSEVLFGQIESIHVTSKKFQQTLQQQHSRDTSRDTSNR